MYLLLFSVVMSIINYETENNFIRKHTLFLILSILLFIIFQNNSGRSKKNNVVVVNKAEGIF